MRGLRAGALAALVAVGAAGAPATTSPPRPGLVCATVTASTGPGVTSGLAGGGVGMGAGGGGGSSWGPPGCAQLTAG